MEIGLGYIIDSPDTLKKSYTEVARISTVNLKAGTSEENPTFTLNLNDDDFEKISDFSQINYLHWFQSGRYYFITDKIFQRGKLVDLVCSCDVLYSFKEDILKSYQFCERSGNKYTSMLPDENYQILNNMDVVPTKICDCPYPQGSHNWILMTATS